MIRRHVPGVALLAAGALLLVHAVAGCELALDTANLTEGTEAGAEASAIDGTTHDSSTADSHVGSDGSGGDGGGPDGTVADGGAADGTVGPDGGPGCTTLYVWGTGGSDSNDGCSPAHALKTIGQALTNAGQGHQATIEVCSTNNQVYDVNGLTVTAPVSLVGGFMCSTTDFGPGDAGRTIITNSQGNGTLATVILAASSDAGALGDGAALPVVEGFDISGATTGGSTAVYAEKGPGTIANCILRGLSMPPTATSVGLSIGASTVTVTGNTLSAGAGAASHGLLISPGNSGIAAPFVLNNTITNGTGTSGVSRYAAVYMSAAYPGAVMMNGDPTTGGASLTGNHIEMAGGLPTIGVNIDSNSTVQVVGNVIEESGSGPDDGGLAPGLASVIGVRISASGEIVLRGNRIYAGGINGPSGKYANWVGDFHGVDVEQAPSDAGGLSGPVVIVNNLIYAGPYAKAPQPAGNALGVFLSGSGTTNSLVLYNTIFSGYPGTGSAATGIKVQASTGAVVDDNILAGVNQGSSGLWVLGGNVASVQNNVFVTVADITQTTAASTDITGAQQSLVSAYGATASGNLVMTSSCSTRDVEGGACVSTASCDGGDVNGCLASLIAGWTPADQGYGLLFGPGWNLAPGVSCSVAHGALDLSDAAPYPVAYDRNGASREPLPSMGATQFDGGCQ